MFYEPWPLERLARSLIIHNEPRHLPLATFLKRSSIEVTHITPISTADQRIPRYKTIIDLATRVDVRDLPMPPVVASFGCGPKRVKFFLQDNLPPASTADSIKAASSSRQ